MSRHPSFDTPLAPAAGQEFFVQWHVTERCNLRCLHCYQLGCAGEELPLAELLSVVDEVDDALAAWSDAYGISFAPRFQVTGGEPLLCEDLWDVLARLRTGGFPTHLLSNGTLVDRDTAERLAGLGVAGVQVSLEGPEAVHDAIRGPGSFRKALRGVDRLLRAGVRIDLNVTLSARNADRVDELIDIAQAAGVPRIGFSRLVPYGRGAELLGETLPPDRVRGLYERLRSVQVPGLAIGTGDPLAAQLDLGGTDGAGCTAVGGCAAGVSGITILPDGTLHPCRRLPIPIGNLRTDSLREVWATSPVLAALRDKGRYPGRCGSCERWAACRGCRAIAYAVTLARGRGDFLADDPQCFL
ncbi:MAG: radical SAM protein [Deferrisomatales bacterium]|nr:radical SAM protein [Deferrisomatales bacterium]